MTRQPQPPQQPQPPRAAIVSRMLLIIFRELRLAYRPHQRNVGRLFQNFIVALEIQNERDRWPCSTRSLSRLSDLPRSNVQRAIKALLRERIIRKQGNGYVGTGRSLMRQVNARHLERIVSAIISTSNTLMIKKNDRVARFGPATDNHHR